MMNLLLIDIFNNCIEKTKQQKSILERMDCISVQLVSNEIIAFKWFSFPFLFFFKTKENSQSIFRQCKFLSSAPEHRICVNNLEKPLVITFPSRTPISEPLFLSRTT